MSVLKCEKLTKSYGNHTVLRDLDLTLYSGKIYGLIGRNGAGKTTLLSLMSNQNPITGGTVTLDGESVWENSKVLHRICFARELNISSESGLSKYTVQRYLQTAATFLPHWDRGLADRLVHNFHLDPKARLGKLSKGMLSMLTITVALASKAEFTFLDEPVAGLDVVAREQFYKLLLDEYTETGRTFVISTHIIEEAADIMEEVIILNQGNILLKENTQALTNRACYVTGLTEEVERAVTGLDCRSTEVLGRSKAVTVLLREDETLPENCDVTVQPLSLQQIETEKPTYAHRSVFLLFVQRFTQNRYNQQCRCTANQSRKQLRPGKHGGQHLQHFLTHNQETSFPYSLCVTANRVKLRLRFPTVGLYKPVTACGVLRIIALVFFFINQEA